MESFPMQLADIPGKITTGNHLNVVYSEREFVGYRYYTSYNVATRYPFGFGLSYCDFKIDAIEIEQTGAYDFTIHFDVENLSDRFDGKEVVQIYLKSHNRFEPKMRLIDYQLARLKKGEKQHYSISIHPRELMHYIGGKKRFFEGAYSLCVATSSEDVIYEQVFTLQEEKSGKITKETQLGRVLGEARYRPIILETMQSVINFWAYGTKKAEKNFENEKFLKESIYSMPFRAFAYFDEQLFDDKKMNALIDRLNQI
jgi:beta-glucosidase